MKEPVKVLIVDDNPMWRTTLEHVLSMFDCVITEVETGEDAFQKISEEYFDLLIFDNFLGSGDTGIEIIRKVREQNLAVGKIFVLTGYTTMSSAVEAMKLGAFDFLDKSSIDLNKLHKKFSNALKY